MPIKSLQKIVKANSKTYINWPAFFLLSVLLAIPRILIFVPVPGAIVGYDSKVRYLGSLLATSEYWQNYFTVTGPLYVLWLQLIKTCSGNNYLFWTVVFQHTIVWASGVISFLILSRIKHDGKTHPVFWFFLILMVFTSPHIIYYEHSIMRESLGIFLTAPALSLLIFSFSLSAEDSRVPFYLLLVTWLLLLGYLVRQEIIFLWLIVVGATWIRLWNTKKLKLAWAMILPALFLFSSFHLGNILLDTEKVFQKAPYSGAKFNIAYHYLRSDNFDYISNKYPLLVERFHALSKERGGVGSAIGKMYEETNSFIANEGTSKNFIAIMDDIFLDQIKFNTFEFIISYLNNVERMLIGNIEFPEKIDLTKVFSNGLVRRVSNTMLSFYSWPDRIELNKINYIIFLTVATLMILYRKKLPLFVAVAFLTSISYLLLVSFMANSVARFRYPMELIYYISAWGGIYFFSISGKSSNLTGK